jgi:hypothetical protein
MLAPNGSSLNREYNLINVLMALALTISVLSQYNSPIEDYTEPYYSIYKHNIPPNHLRCCSGSPRLIKKVNSLILLL